MSKQVFIDEALQILADLGLPPAQRNERSALRLLALIDLQPDGKWTVLKSPLMGITPVMDWIAKHYGKQYAPNTRETIRRQTMHQFVDAGIALYNPDDPLRSVNSPKAVYQISPACLALLKTHSTASWDEKLLAYKGQWQTLADRYAKDDSSGRGTTWLTMPSRCASSALQTSAVGKSHFFRSGRAGLRGRKETSITARDLDHCS